MAPHKPIRAGRILIYQTIVTLRAYVGTSAKWSDYMPKLTRRELASGMAQMSGTDITSAAVVLRAFKICGKLRYRLVVPPDGETGRETTIYPPNYHLAQKWFDLECAKLGR